MLLHAFVRRLTRLFGISVLLCLALVPKAAADGQVAGNGGPGGDGGAGGPACSGGLVGPIVIMSDNSCNGGPGGSGGPGGPGGPVGD